MIRVETSCKSQFNNLNNINHNNTDSNNNNNNNTSSTTTNKKNNNHIKKRKRRETQLKTNRKLKLLDYYNKNNLSLFIIIAVSNIYNFDLWFYKPPI